MCTKTLIESIVVACFAASHKEKISYSFKNSLKKTTKDSIKRDVLILVIHICMYILH